MTQLLPNERVDYLVHEDLKIIQSPSVFSFSLDAVLLSRFAWVPIKRGKIIDLCSGNGAVALLLTKRSNALITGVEIQEKLHSMAKRSVALNELTTQVQMDLGDIKEAPARYGFGTFDALTCNPPYFPSMNEIDHNLNEHLAIARHEIHCSLEDVIRVSSQLVKQGGKVSMVHRPNRLMEILAYMRQYQLEPKKLQLIYPKSGSEANMLLIEGLKNGKPDLHIMPPLTVYGNDGEYTSELKRMFYGES
ncbi:tRNA1(Val) (adenine(37)-N6)-methyltransferase [Bacillus sp. NEB1478]|uniref:tRNA1(Val) (adenine(37)-N6)-methyltransferase n=1 Tax=Bacillus sp. NEB1478 TaxID=3073816 RepID=UPI002873B2C8|nr:tRNA1(Val) (adenine(37)-N6)-methyltransferase [Bacillus sp. NEB1478]WNB92049.1 tRNA1(Val) (adenine(37)-N6)-methyltransferase [Bacillus sp. NEB1478]